MNLDTGDDAEAMEGLLRIDLLHMALSAYFPIQPSAAVLPPQWAILSHISHSSRKYLTDLPTGHFDGGIFLFVVPSL